MSIFLKNEILKDDRISNEGRFVYTCLRCLKINYDYKNKEICEDVRVIHPKTLYYNLFAELREIGKYEKEVIHKGIINLAEMGLISIIEHDKDFYVLDIGGLYLESVGTINYFTLVLKENIKKLFFEKMTEGNGEVTGKEMNPNRYRLFGLYLIMLATINNRHDYGTIIEKNLAKMADISKRAVVYYIDYLEKLELIYVYRSSVKTVRKNEDGITHELVNTVNMYGEYWKKGLIEKLGKSRDQYLLDNDGVEGKANAKGKVS